MRLLLFALLLCGRRFRLPLLFLFVLPLHFALRARLPLLLRSDPLPFPFVRLHLLLFARRHLLFPANLFQFDLHRPLLSRLPCELFLPRPRPFDLPLRSDRLPPLLFALPRPLLRMARHLFL
jgi:hypothetical protein